MADQTLPNLPNNLNLNTGALLYVVMGGASYNTTANTLGNLIINAFGLATENSLNILSGIVVTGGQVNAQFVTYTTGNQIISGIKSFSSGLFPNFFSGNQLIIGSNIINPQNNNLIILNNLNDNGLYLQNKTGGIVLTTNNLRGSGINLNGFTFANGPLYVYNSTGLQTGIQLIAFDGINGFVNINDLNGNLSSDFNNRIATSSIGQLSIDWENQLLYANAPEQTLDWNNQVLLSTNAGGNTVLDWSVGTLYDFNQITGLNWNSRNLYDSNNLICLDWGNRALKDNDGTGITSVDWLNRSLFDSNNQLFLDWSNTNSSNINPNRTNLTVDGIAVANWSSGTLFSNNPHFPVNNTGTTSLNWNNRVLYDNNVLFLPPYVSAVSIDWGNRFLYDNTATVTGNISGGVSIDYGNRILIGNWTSNNFLLTGSNPVYVTGNQTITGTKVFSMIVPNVISGGGMMVDSSNLTSVQWNNRVLTNTVGINVIDWQNTILIDANGNQANNWSNRQLFDSTGALSLDYNVRTLAGNWNVSITGVSGLLGTGNIIAGTGISITQNGTNVIINNSGISLVYNMDITGYSQLYISGGVLSWR